MEVKKVGPVVAGGEKLLGAKPPLRKGHPYASTDRTNYLFISMEFTPEVDVRVLETFEQKVADLYHSMIPHASGQVGIEIAHPWVRVLP